MFLKSSYFFWVGYIRSSVAFKKMYKRYKLSLYIHIRSSHKAMLYEHWAPFYSLITSVLLKDVQVSLVAFVYPHSE